MLAPLAKSVRLTFLTVAPSMSDSSCWRTAVSTRSFNSFATSTSDVKITHWIPGR